MNDERFWLLVSLKFSGEANVEEQKELNEILKQHPEMKENSEMLMNLWKKKQSHPSDRKKQAFENHLKRLNKNFVVEEVQYETSDQAEENIANEEITSKLRSKYRMVWWSGGIAASVLSAVFLFFQLTNKSSNERLAKNIVTTKPGSKSNIQLPDGTQVWLNADSKISYPEKFLGKSREISLSGEAYFDVVKDPSRPFTIHTNALDVKVLGTAFNVRSYPDEKTTETALIRGSIQIILHGDPDRPIFMKPNDKVIINNNTGNPTDTLSNETRPKKIENEKPLMILDKVHIDTVEKAAVEAIWVSNKLAFDYKSLERIVAEIEHWYDAEITVDIDQERMKSMHFHGTFENKSLEDVIGSLCLSYHLHYLIKDTKVTIWMK
jgi:transmembrane sensor